MAAEVTRVRIIFMTGWEISERNLLWGVGVELGWVGHVKREWEECWGGDFQNFRLDDWKKVGLWSGF